MERKNYIRNKIVKILKKLNKGEKAQIMVKYKLTINSRNWRAIVNCIYRKQIQERKAKTAKPSLSF